MKRYRQSGRWIEGIHWIQLGQQLIRYNWPLIQDWLQNSNNPEAHQRAIEAYRSTLRLLYGGDKFNDYQTLESLQEYLLINTNESRSSVAIPRVGYCKPTTKAHSPYRA